MFYKLRVILTVSFIILSISLISCKAAEEADKTIKDGTKTMMAQPDRARTLSDLTSIRQSIQMYSATNNSYPKSLAELKLNLNSPDDIVYDSAKGTAKSKTFPGL